MEELKKLPFWETLAPSSQDSLTFFIEALKNNIKSEIFKKMDEYEYHKDEVHCTCLGALREWMKEQK